MSQTTEIPWSSWPPLPRNEVYCRKEAFQAQRWQPWHSSATGQGQFQMMFIMPSECEAEITLLLVNFWSVTSVFLSFVWCCFRPKLSYHSRAPEHQGLPSYLTDAIVTELRSGLDMDVVRKGNENVKNGTSQIGMIWSFNGYGLLNKSDQFWYLCCGN